MRKTQKTLEAKVMALFIITISLAALAEVLAFPILHGNY